MKIGIVLGGGAVKGAYQIGFLKALLQHISMDEVKALSCSSIGVINGYALVSNKLNQAYDIWKSLNYENMLDLIDGVWHKKLLKNIINTISQPTDKLSIPMYTSVCFLPLIKLQYYKFFGEYKANWHKIMNGATFFPLF